MAFMQAKTLFYLASSGAFTMISIGLYSFFKSNNPYQDTIYFKETMDTLQKHPGATKFLGQPLNGRKVNLIKSDESIAQFSAIVKGASSNGTVFFWVEKIVIGENVSTRVNRIELELPFEKNKRLLIKG